MMWYVWGRKTIAWCLLWWRSAQNLGMYAYCLKQNAMEIRGCKMKGAKKVPKKSDVNKSKRGQYCTTERQMYSMELKQRSNSWRQNKWSKVLKRNEPVYLAPMYVQKPITEWTRNVTQKGQTGNRWKQTGAVRKDATCHGNQEENLFSCTQGTYERELHHAIGGVLWTVSRTTPEGSDLPKGDVEFEINTVGKGACSFWTKPPYRLSRQGGTEWVSKLKSMTYASSGTYSPFAESLWAHLFSVRTKERWPMTDEHWLLCGE